MKTIKILLCLVLCVCLLTACGGAGEDTPTLTTQPGQSQTVGYPLPEDNKKATITVLGEVCPSSSADGHYVCTNIVRFCAGSGIKRVTLCAQAGCSHQDSTCQAWIGEAMHYTEYQGKLYAIVQVRDSCISFVAKDLTDGTITILDTWEDTANSFYTVSLGPIADQIAVLLVTKTVTTTKNDKPVSQQEESFWRYNLQSGEKRMIFSGPQAKHLSVMAVSSNYMAVMCSKGNSDQLTKAEFETQYGENTDYTRYLFRTDYKELRLYNSDASVCTVVASSEQNGLIPTADPCNTYGKEVVYQCGDTMYLLNVDTGKSRAVVTMENIVNYWVMDHKIFLIAYNVPWYVKSDPDKVVSIYVVDFDNGVPVKLGNGGNIESMEFSVFQEGTSFFVGRWNGGNYKISKEDFYADRYENAKLIG